MNTRMTTLIAADLLGGSLALAGCSAGDDPAEPSASQSEDAPGGHGGMDHPADGGSVPEGMTEAVDPEYPVGTEVTLTADHMDGMDGATAIIVGAYDTHTYAIDYTPVGGGEPVTDHKWIVHEELQNLGEERLAAGTEVTVTADHMDGMDGAKATIASSTDETVYVVDYEAGDMEMTNHKWVVESEIQPAS